VAQASFHPATSSETELRQFDRERQRGRSATVAGMLLGLAATIVFYLVAPWVAQPFAGWPEFVQRYFCGHPLEYITSGMFFVGMGILWNKLRQLPRERRALRSLRGAAESGGWPGNSTTPAEAAESLSVWQRQSRAAGLNRTLLAQRLNDVLHYFSSREDGVLEDHLKYLADLASDRLLQSYSLIRTVTWAVPIMGFLGTVVGITMAIANVTPEQLDSSLPEVTAGLAVAFDTTAQALGMSMVLVFSTFLVERSEQSILNDVEQFGIDHLVPSLARVAEQSEQPVTGMPAVADWTTRMLAEQTEAWGRHLASLQNGWADALTQQSDEMARALSQETQSTLEMHRNSLHDARDLYATILQQSTHDFTSQMQRTLLAFCERVDAWQNALQTTALSSASQAEELHRLGRTMLQLTESEERLAQLQDLLNENLQTLQVVATLEQTVNSLNAAVHVLTAKTALRSAA
jgi:biopolymer transport protein ExbB/TolQ